MKFLILGAGGIGAYFGSRLLQAGHPVRFIVRGDHGRALRDGELVLEHPEHPFAGAVDTVEAATLSPEVLADADALLVCVKSTATAAVATSLAILLDQLRPATGPLVVSLQNGVDNEAALASTIGTHRLVGGLTRRIGAHIVAPGRVWATGPGETILGRWPSDERCAADAPGPERLAAIAAAFNGAGIPTEVSPDIHTELWRKLVINNGVNALAALIREETGTIMADTALSALVHRLMTEAAAAARADGIMLDRETVDAMHHLISTFDSIKPSMLVDRERGREPELDAICGAVLSRCERQGADAPYTRTIETLLRNALAEDGG